ncbi:hypothetical protein [Usitatibacter palustris]|uniref:Uncharacterized protein n=1 Tax=Usitatibacter palustris TaxID=2732487 RepID=A0A6M4H535_9PROT|nr:hypothetical protein [Usitatibacter palustris]QJR14761.1 hypothetical protein DSM104440_01571 [Usitatibacter palustris]
MAVDAQAVFEEMMAAGATAFGQGWKAVETYASAEFEKLADHLADIAENVALYEENPEEGYSPKTARKLFKIQRDACERVIVAVTQLPPAAVQIAMNAIMEVLKDTFGAAIAEIA